MRTSLSVGVYVCVKERERETGSLVPIFWGIRQRGSREG